MDTSINEINGYDIRQAASRYSTTQTNSNSRVENSDDSKLEETSSDEHWSHLTPGERAVLRSLSEILRRPLKVIY
jgi:hypothetical protein